MESLLSSLQTRNLKQKIYTWLKEEFVVSKLDTPFGYAFLGLSTLMLAFLCGYFGMTAAILVSAAVIGVPMVIASMLNLRFGVILITIIAYVVLGVKRYAEAVPLGLAMDILSVIMLMGLLIKQSKERDWSFMRSPVSTLVIMWMFYSVAMLANPEAPSRIAWAYVIRSMAGLMVMYFIMLYAIDSFRFIKQLTNTLIGLLLAAALYGIKQKFLGFSAYEYNWVVSDPLRYDLYFIWGQMRIFSFMSDPSIFGILMACGAMFTFTLALGKNKKRRKIFLFGATLAMLMSMAFAGTRTAYVVVPAALCFLVLLTFNRRIILAGAIFAFLGLGYIASNPYSPIAQRITSAFSPGDDESYSVREENQRFIQPYIQTHPFGSGLGSTGVWGQRFSPHTWQAKFPPDSGYVMIGVEMGWMGLLLYCAMLFVGFRQGVIGYFRSRNHQIRTYYQAYLVLLIGMTLANFAQLVFMQTPGNLTFYIILAMLVKLKDFDTEEELTRIEKEKEEASETRLGQKEFALNNS